MVVGCEDFTGRDLMLVIHKANLFNLAPYTVPTLCGNWPVKMMHEDHIDSDTFITADMNAIRLRMQMLDG